MPKPTAIRQRRAHKKSRNGCASCKRFRVKCDEQGPPCSNCTLRLLDCVYAAEAPHEKPGGSRAHDACAALRGPARGARELLELELMRRWCTRTYTGFVFHEQEYAFATVELPRAALGSGMVLSYLFAAAALDVATTQASPPRALRYAGLALRYYDAAAADYRAGAARPTRDSHWLYSTMGLYMANFHIGLVRVTAAATRARAGPASLLPALRTAFGLMHSAAVASRRHMDWLLRMPYPFGVFATILSDPPPLDILDDETRAACACLHSLNAKLYPTARAGAHPGAATPPDPPAPDQLSAPTPAPDDRAAYYRFYERNIATLERLWAEEARGLVKANFWFFPPRALADKPEPWRPTEAMELLILLHWATLLHQSRSYYWWVGDTGTRLVAECCGAIRRMPISREPEAKASMAWVRLRVGLPPDMAAEYPIAPREMASSSPLLSEKPKP